MLIICNSVFKIGKLIMYEVIQNPVSCLQSLNYHCGIGTKLCFGLDMR